MTTREKLEEQLKKVPDKPGVYVFKDPAGRILYIGKGGSLRKRMRSYFQKEPYSPKTQVMINKTADFDIYVTENEVEALILEASLIKKNRPTFNVTFRDDKSYPFLAITVGDKFPRVAVTREIHRPGTVYYGPYTKAYAIRETLDTLRRVFPIRNCSGTKFARHKARKSPCLEYHIKRCPGPCADLVSSEDYRVLVDRIRAFLEGKQDDVLEELQREMKEAAVNLEFERAARIRDRLEAARHVLERQRIVSETRQDQDVLAVAENEQFACVQLMAIRQGKLVESENFVMNRGSGDVLSSFVKQYYMASSTIPPRMLLPYPAEDQALLADWLTQKRGSRVELKVPQRGDKKDLVQLAEENALHALELERTKHEYEKQKAEKALTQLKDYLGLPRLPRRIECFDVSTIMGRESVGSMVVFEEARPKRQGYRRFKIKWVPGMNDYAMMQEIITRRFSRGVEETQFATPPDLVLVDGGKPQLSATLSALKSLNIESVPVAALAKREEELYLPDRTEPISLPSFSEGLYLVKRVRDEAHRFAITYHRELREKRMVRSIFDEIPGVGEQRKKMLIRQFGSAKRVLEASLAELEELLPDAVALRIYRYLHPGAEAQGSKLGVKS
jgi:excinuclease ABC subunit C